MGDSRWHKPFYFGSPTVEIHRAWIVALLFEIIYLIGLLALVGFLMRGTSMRTVPRKIPLVPLLSSLASNALASFLSVITLFFNVLQSTVTQSYVVLLMIQTLAQMAGYVMMFFVFYRVLSYYLKRISTSRERPLLIDAVHYFILTLLAIISAVKSILYIVALAQNVSDLYSELTSTYLNITASQDMLFWLASLEMVGCAAFVMVRSRNYELSCRSGLTWIFSGSVSFWGLHFFHLITAIEYNLEMTPTPPNMVAAVPTAIFAVFMLGAYAGILGSCMCLYKQDVESSASRPVNLERKHPTMSVKA